jgi:hypothetical protein
MQNDENRLKMINRLLTMITGIKHEDNRRLSPEHEYIFRFYTYTQIVKPLIMADADKGMKLNSIALKYNLDYKTVERIVKIFDIMSSKNQYM